MAKRPGSGDDAPQPAGRKKKTSTRKAADAPPDWKSIHLWQIQPVRDVLIVAAVVALFLLGKYLSIVTVPLLLALALAYLVEPVVTRLADMRHPFSSRSLGRTGGVTVILVAVVLVIVGAALAGTYGAVQLVSSIAGLERTVTDVYAYVDAPTSELEAPSEGDVNTTRGEAMLAELPNAFWREVATTIHENREEGGTPARQFLDILRANSEDLIRQGLRTGANALAAVLSLVTSAFFVAMTIFFTLFFFYFFSTGYPKTLEFFRGLIPERYEDRTLDLVSQMDSVIAGFVRGRLTIAFIQSIVFTIGYVLIGVPAAFILGPLVAILSIVPYLALVGVPISITLMLLDPSGFFAFQKSWLWAIIAPTAFYFIGQALDDYVWTPMIQGKATNMDTPTILFATIAGGALLGVFGMLIAIPLAACIKILLREIFWPRFKQWAEGERPDFLPLGRADDSP